MTKLRKIKGTLKNGVIYTETGHKIEFEPVLELSVDLDQKEYDLPFFLFDIKTIYKGTDFNGTKNMTIKEIEEMTSKRRINNYWKNQELYNNYILS